MAVDTVVKPDCKDWMALLIVVLRVERAVARVTKAYNAFRSSSSLLMAI